MNKKYIYGLLMFISGCFFKGTYFFMNAQIKELAALFPETPAAITQLTNDIIEKTTHSFNDLIAIPKNMRTFDNTIRAYDTMTRDLGTAAQALETIELVHPHDEVRAEAHEMILQLQKFSIDFLYNNIQLYHAILEYTNAADYTKLTQEQQYYIQELLRTFKKEGLSLPEAEQTVIKQFKKELANLELTFQTNINQSTNSIQATSDELAGVPTEWIAHQKTDSSGRIIIGTDYPSYTVVMENCAVEATRKALWKAYMSRAYPENNTVLEAVIAKRDSLAKKLGFPSYADFIIDDEMAQTPTIVDAFLKNIRQRAHIKVEKEMHQLQQELPHGVVLSADKKFKPWDLAYTKNLYKKKHYSIDEQKIAEYFPMENSITMLLNIYEQFLDMQFEQHPTHDLFWHPDVRLISVKKDGAVLGYLLLDLFPRPHKYNHACEITIVPAQKIKDTRTTAVAVVIANFPKPNASRPSLLKLHDVQTFFHEFGHAIHALLGATELANLSGTRVKRDFVEMPSQMLEEWLYDPAILKMVSSHYKTHEPLPDDIINRIIALKNFDSGDQTQRQISFAFLSLECFKDGAHKNVPALKENIFEKTRPFIQFLPDDHFESAFGHLMGYSAQYYGYMWSKVFALDMFDHIKKQGLLNPVIGKKYIAEVIGKGGSEHPEKLIENFLGRKPNSDAFFKDLGI